MMIFPKVQYGERAFMNAPEAGHVNIYLVLDNLTEEELRSLKGNLSLIVHDYEIPVLVTSFEGMSFDMPILGNKNRIKGNAITLYVIDLKGYVLKQMRVLGASEELAEAIHEGVLYASKLDKITLMQTLQAVVYPNHTPGEMLKGGVRQRFGRGE
jgi:hypothetical protein